MSIFAYISGRRMGKTEAIVSWLLSDPECRTIIVCDRHRQEHIINVIGRKVKYTRGRKFWEERVVIFDLRYNAMRGKYPGLVAIDDLDTILQIMFHSSRDRVDLVTMTATCIQDFTDEEQSKEYIDSDAWEDSDERRGLDHVRRIKRMAVYEAEHPRELPSSGHPDD